MVSASRPPTSDERTAYPSRGSVLLEALVGIALFAILGVTVYQAINGLISALTVARVQLVAVELMKEQVEIVRNLPYTDVGIFGGIPVGALPATQSVTRSGFEFLVSIEVENIDDPFDGTIGTDDTSAVADYRRVDVTVACTNCALPSTSRFSTLQAPLALESSSSDNGALFIRVLDATGQPVESAAVAVLNTEPNPDISVSGTTDAEGWYRLIDVPAGTNAYAVTVTKDGHSSARTYPPGGSGLSNPDMPHATVSPQSVTQMSFAIDLTGTVGVSTVTTACDALSDVTFRMYGSKTLGTDGGSTVRAYDENLTTDGLGQLALTDLEWDTYTVEPVSIPEGIRGTEPLTPVELLPGADQSLQLFVGPSASRTLVVAVKDGATDLPLTGATVSIDKSSFTEQTLVTGEGFLSQTDWSDGDGQETFVNDDEYLWQNGDIEDNDPDGELRLDSYVISGGGGGPCPWWAWWCDDDEDETVHYTPGELISSTFDNGGAGNYHEIFWLPADQPSQTGADSVLLQIATNNDGETWEFLGPDGTPDTYYTPTNTTINPLHDGDQYLRYRIILQTENDSYTPNVSDVFFTFTQDCTPPGQVAFSGLPSGTYTVTVTKPGYQQSTTNATLSSEETWELHDVVLTP